jgi:hypothetical protein
MEKTNPPLTDEAARLAEVERLALAERERRIDEAVERGEAVRVHLNIVCADEDDLEEARIRERTDKVSELRRAGEQRKPAFDEFIITTGVPRPGRDEKYVARLTKESAEQRREREAAAAAVVESFHEGAKSHEPEPNIPPLPPPPPEPSRDLTWSSFVVQVSAPTDNDPGGVIAEGRLAVDGHTLYVEDHEGRRVGSRELAPGDNAKALAKRMLRDRQKPGAFWQPLDYAGDRLS